MVMNLLEQLHPVDVTVLNLQPFTVHILGIRQMQVGGEWKYLIEELPEWEVQMVAGEFRVRNVQTNTHPLVHTELMDEVGIHKKVVEALSTEVPGEGGHGLGNDLHLT